DDRPAGADDGDDVDAVVREVADVQDALSLRAAERLRGLDIEDLHGPSASATGATASARRMTASERRPAPMTASVRARRTRATVSRVDGSSPTVAQAAAIAASAAPGWPGRKNRSRPTATDIACTNAASAIPAGAPRARNAREISPAHSTRSARCQAEPMVNAGARRRRVWAGTAARWPRAR